MQRGNPPWYDVDRIRWSRLFFCLWILRHLAVFWVHRCLFPLTTLRWHLLFCLTVHINMADGLYSTRVRQTKRLQCVKMLSRAFKPPKMCSCLKTVALADGGWSGEVGVKPYLLLSESVSFQFTLTEQLGSTKTAQRLFFDLPVQQSGFERHLDQTSLR